ncbi:MAG: hypothetical protein QUS08_07205 [Methanothrix sp.]|nr:hypothetical protein [Methanothrix sp.]
MVITGYYSFFDIKQSSALSHLWKLIIAFKFCISLPDPSLSSPQLHPDVDKGDADQVQGSGSNPDAGLQRTEKSNPAGP